MFYINTNLQFNPFSIKRGNTSVANLPLDITVTPRFEHRLISVYLPINTTNTVALIWEAGLRIAQVTMGSSTILTSFAKKKFTGVDFYFEYWFWTRKKLRKKVKSKDIVQDKTTTML